MATYDGSLKFDTKVDTSGFDKGLSTIKKAAGALGLAKLSKEIIDVGSTFEASMSQVAAISMATGDDLNALTAAAKEMGATTKYTAAEAADGLQYLSLAGYSAKESIEALPKVLRLAQAGGMDLAYASDLLTDSMAVMGLGIKDMDNFSDQLAMAASKSNTSVAQLGEAVLIAGGQAKLAAMSTEEMNTALGILADNGIKGSEGGTALRNVLKNLYTPTSASAKVMQKLGIKTADANGKLKDAQVVLQELKGKLDKMSESSRIKTMGEIFDTRTIAAANALLSNSGERWDELQGYLSDCNGAAKTMAETMNDNLQGSMTIMKSSLEALGITVYETAEPALRSMVEVLTDIIGAADSFLGANDGLNLLTIATNIGFVTSALVGYKTATGLATTAQALFNSTLALSPVGLAGAGLAALAAVAFTVVTAVKSADEEYYRMGERLSDVGSKFDTVKEKSTVTEEHIAAWRELRAKIDDNTLSADALAKAESEIKGHEQWFIDNYGNYISAEEEKNGIRVETVDLLERESDALSKIAALELESELIEMSSDIPGLQEKVAVLEEVNKSLENEQIEMLGTKTALQKLYAEWDKFASSADFSVTGQETADKLNEIGEACEALGINIDMGGEPSITRLCEKILELDKQTNGLGKAISDNTQKIEDGKNTLDTYAEKVKKLIDFDADATYDEKVSQATEFGVNYAEGLVVGIDKGSPMVVARIDQLATEMEEKLRKKLDIHSPSRVTRYIGQMLSIGAAYGIEDKADMAVSAMEAMSAGIIDKSLKGAERQEAIRERTLKSLKNSLDIGLITEEKYYEELEKIRDTYFADGSEEWEKYTLQILKYNIESAEEQRKSVSNIYDGMVDDINSRLDEIKKSRDAFADSLRNVEDGFRTVTYVGMGVNDTDIVDTMLNVTGLKQANDLKEAFGKSATAAKKRIEEALGGENKELSDRIYEGILGKGAEEGIKLSDAIINSNSTTFAQWIAEQIRGEELSKTVSSALYADKFAEVGEEMSKGLYEAWDKELSEQFGELPEDFWSFGADAAEGFYDGFMNDINAYMNAIERHIAIRISEITSSSIASGGSGGGTTYSPSYYIQPSSGENTQAQLSAIHNAEALEKARGGY